MWRRRACVWPRTSTTCVQISLYVTNIALPHANSNKHESVKNTNACEWIWCNGQIPPSQLPKNVPHAEPPSISAPFLLHNPETVPHTNYGWCILGK